MCSNFSTDVPNTLNLESLKELYDELKKNEDGVECTGDVINCITDTIVQVFNDDLNESYGEIVKKKSYALRCLTLMPIALTSDFYDKFFSSLRYVVELSNPFLITTSTFYVLEAYIRFSPNHREKLLMINSFMICLANSTVNFEIFDHFAPNEWRKELLIYSLCNECDCDTDKVQRLIDKMNESFKQNNGKRCLEDILDILLCNLKNIDFNIYFLDDIFVFISRKPEKIENIFENLVEIQNEINTLKMEMLYARFSTKVQSLNNQIAEFDYFCKYPFHILEVLLQHVTGNIEELLDVKHLFDTNKMELHNQINVILKLNSKYTIHKLKFDVAFAIVRDIIAVIFPTYKTYSCQTNKKFENVDIALLSTICVCPNSECWLFYSCEICNLLYDLNSSIAKLILNSIEILDQVIELIGLVISEIRNAQHIIYLSDALYTLEDYEMKITTYEDMRVIFFLILNQEIHRYVVQEAFSGSFEKTIDYLLDEIEELYPGVTGPIIEMFDKVQICYDQISQLLPEEGPIKGWNENQIRMWADLAKLPISQPCDEEILAIIKTAARVTVNLQLRDIQLISILLMIKSNKKKGRLCQINTGEGKTLVIAALAAYSVLKGHTVDIYTSSSVLAIPQYKEYKHFYNVLNITVTHNINYNSNYDCDVIYGTNNSFQRDVLLDEFRKSSVRKSRKFDVAIVDEVDNMLIDGNNSILLISCDMPAMDYLEVLLAAIYIQVNEAAGSLIEKGGRTYYLVQEPAIEDDGNLKQEILVEEVEIEGSKREFIIRCTETHLRKLIRDTEHCKKLDETYPEIKIPNHLREVICKVQLKKWISNAVNAVFMYVKDEDYILKNGKIVIVDANNTGTVKLNSNWSGGLHQFLEIKHGARVRPESFTTNFLSNVGLFTRYDSKLLGLTGTLGTEESKVFLQTTYDVDSVVIPPFKLKQHKHMKPILVSGTENKYSQIAISCIRRLKQGQAALIIMKYIRETQEIAEVFINNFHYDSNKVKIVKTDDDSEILEKPLHPGEVIITTNIAGRGTDVKLTDDVEQNGGLHVCLTFLPLNSRVEHQNIGRTSRKGNRGTSQLVISDPQNLCDIERLKKIRNSKEAKTISKASETVKRVKLKDRIFRKFCSLLDELTVRNNDTKKINQTAVEERFAIWLILNENELDSNSNDIEKSFEEFKKEILNDDCNNSLIKNPCMLISLGNNYLIDKRYNEAIDEYNSAIILDHHFSEFAYYNRARAYLAKYGENMSKYEFYMDQAIEDLKEARKLIEEKEYSLHLLQTASKGEVFSEQVSNKLNLYNLIKNTIELAIGPDTDAINDQIVKLEKDLNNDNLPSDVKSKINEQLNNLKEYKNEIGIIGRAKYKKRNIRVDSLGDDFMPTSDLETHKLELQEIKRNGWIEGFKVTEIKPIDWLTVISMLGIGLGQLVIGAALTVFSLGAGATIGMGLISEGVNDIIIAVKNGIINRDFDWTTWALMKVISVAVSVVCAGFKAIKDAAKAAYAGAKSVVSSGAKMLTQTTKDGWKIVATKMGLDMAKGVAKEIVTDIVSYGVDKMILPLIEEIIVEQVRQPIQTSLLNNTKVATMLKLDLKNGNHVYENKIKDIAQKLLTPIECSKLESIATTIATQIADRKGLALTRQVCTSIVGVCEITTLTHDFIENVTRKIDGIEIKESLDEDVNELPNESQLHEIVDQENYGDAYKHNKEDIDLSRVEKLQEQIKLERKPQTTDNLSRVMTDMVSKNMINILKGKIVRPVIQIGANYSVDKLSSRVNECLNNNIENYRSKKNIIRYQNKAYVNSEQDSEKNIYKVEEIKKVNKILDELKKGGPAGLVHLGAISDATNKPIEVFDQKGRLKYTIGDNKNSKPIQVQYHPTENESGTGHFTLKDYGEPSQKSNSENMCLFNVVAEQTGQNPDDLKNKTLFIMENNKNNVAKQVKHLIRLEMYDKSSLLQGGAQYDGTCPDHALQYLISSNGTRGFKNKVPGHADIHIPFKGKTIDKLYAITEESKCQIEVYDKNGKLSYIVGEKTDKNAIKLQYYKPEGDTSAECFSSVGGNERYYLHNPNDMHLYNIVSQQTGLNASSLKAATLNRLDTIKIPPHKTCIENELEKTGFVSLEEQSYVLDCAFKTEVAQQAMQELNEYKTGINNSKKFFRKELRISAKELNLSRTAYGGKWENGKLKLTWPITDIFLLLQHHKGQEENPKAPVHIQTFYPYPPKNSSSPP